MNALRAVHDELLSAYGPQAWWPADTGFEVMVGAILTQNTAWSNVEKAIAGLRQADLLEAEAIRTSTDDQLAQCIRPSGYFNVKAKRLKYFCEWYVQAGGFEKLAQTETGRLRTSLLGINGIGPETADDMMLYAFERPVFVIDAYTRRLLSRLGLCKGDEPYDELRRWCEGELGEDVPLYNEFHALIVRHAKERCSKRGPSCHACTLQPGCAYAAA